MYCKKCNIALGRFQPFTNGHLQMLQDGYDKNGLPVVVFMIANKKFDEKHPFSDELIAKEMEIVKKNYKFIADIVPANSADIVKIGQKLSELGYEAHLWLCGDDREVQFKRQAENPKYQDLGGFPSDFTTYTGSGRVEGVSGTAVRNALKNNDKDMFKKLTPKGVDVMFDEFKEAINKINEGYRMISLSKYLNESLVNRDHINEGIINIKDYRRLVKPCVTPKDKKELQQIIEDTIKKEGNKCNLNFIDTSKITDMNNLFADISFNGDISMWDVSNVKNMAYIFWNSEFNGDISKWDVSNVTNMSGMFRNGEFNRNISDWDVSNVKNMSYMFQNSKFTGDISRWKLSNVKDMDHMFYDAMFNGDISKWDVSNVEDMNSMFYNSQFNRNISNWDVSNVIDMMDMFAYSEFTGDISKWKLSKIKYMTHMFNDSPLQMIYGSTPHINKDGHFSKL